MVIAYIYIEGGARGEYSKEVTVRCQRAFRKLFERLGLQGRLPRLVARGGRDSVYKDFVIQHLMSSPGIYTGMLIDSEEPMEDIERSWEHLANVSTVAKWKRPVRVRDDQVLFMTTCMETWIAADRVTLKQHFGKRLRESALPSLVGIEKRPRDEVQEGLIRATSNCLSPYRKGKVSFEILAKLNPEPLEELPSFARIHRILNDKLKAPTKSRAKKRSPRQ